MSSEYVTELKAQLYSAEQEIERLQAELAEARDDYLRRHKEAADNFDRAIAAESSLTALRAALEDLLTEDFAGGPKAYAEHLVRQLRAALASTPPDAVKVAGVLEAAKAWSMGKRKTAGSTNVFDFGAMLELEDNLTAAVTVYTGEEDQP